MLLDNQSPKTLSDRVHKPIGPPAKLDTTVLIHQLEDDRLYSPKTAARTLLNPGLQKDRYKRMRGRLYTFAITHGIKADREGRVDGSAAWYGRTWKKAFGGYELARGAGAVSILRVLYMILKQKIALAEAESLARLQKRLRADTTGSAPTVYSGDGKQHRSPRSRAESLPPSSRNINLGVRFFRSGWAVAFLLLAAVLVYAYVARMPFDPTGGKQRIAVLTCYQDNMGAVIQDMVTRSLAETDVFSPMDAFRIENRMGTINVCQIPTETMLQNFFDVLNVRYLLWGQTIRQGRGYSWHGFLCRDDGEQRVIKVKADHYRALADGIVQKNLALMGSTEKPPSAIQLYSSNMNASFLFSEANIHFGNGNILAASAHYKRVATVFDSDFLLARIRWARCLELQGEVSSARGILEAVLTRDSETIEKPVLIEIYRNLAYFYYLNDEIGKLHDLLQEVEHLEMPTRDALFFKNYASLLYLIRGEMDAALESVNETTLITRGTKDFKSRVDVLWVGASIEANSGRYDEAMNLLDQALELAQLYDLPSRRSIVLGLKARTSLALNDEDQIIELLDILKNNADSAENPWNRLKLNYWIGRLSLRLGEEQGYALLARVARDAQNMGMIKFEIQAKQHLIHILLRQENLTEAERLIEPLWQKLEILPPRYQVIVLDIKARVEFSRSRYAESLATLQRGAAIAGECENPSYLVLILHAMGVAHARLDQFEQAETSYLTAYRLNMKQKRRNSELLEATLTQIVDLYTKYQQPEKAENFSEILGNLNKK